MDVSTRIQLSRRLNECVDEIIVLLSTYTLLLESEVDIVVEKFFIVCSAVENNGERTVWVDAGAESGQDQLCDRDQNTTHALIPDSEDLFAI